MLRNPNPNPNPSPSDPYVSSHYSHYSQNPQLPLPRVYSDPSAASTAELTPPGVDSYPCIASLPQPQLPQVPAMSYLQTDTAGYYFDPTLQNGAAKEAVQQYEAAVSVTVPQNGTEQLAVAQPGSTEWTNFTYQLPGNGNWKKRQKKTKVVQSAYCDVCKVDCNSKEVLEQHKLGKKHKKNLEKLQLAAAGSSALSGSGNPIIGPQLDPNKAGHDNIQTAKKKAARPLEDLETKRRKIVEGGAAQEAVRVCAICNVVCNSEGVYNFHLAGRKHAAMLKKHMGGALEWNP